MAAFYQRFTNAIYQFCFEKIKGKEGLVRSTILSRTLEFSARSVVAIDPSIKPYELHIPREILFRLWSPYFLNYLAEHDNMRLDRLYPNVVEKNYEELKKDEAMFKKFLDFLDWFSKSPEAMTYRDEFNHEMNLRNLK